ncbi:hypothetical protein EDB86DRAFT_2834863 [Lactarius hatsudake]|nr:hypothetical protein EDB86DRAFT_2834863 [Lactarius hatsudake]
MTRRRGITGMGIIGTFAGALRTRRARRTNTRNMRDGAGELVTTTTATASDTGRLTHERDGSDDVPIDACTLEAAEREPERIVYGARRRRAGCCGELRRAEHGPARTPPYFARELLRRAERAAAVVLWRRGSEPEQHVRATLVRETGDARGGRRESSRGEIGCAREGRGWRKEDGESQREVGEAGAAGAGTGDDERLEMTTPESWIYKGYSGLLRGAATARGELRATGVGSMARSAG